MFYFATTSCSKIRHDNEKPQAGRPMPSGFLGLYTVIYPCCPTSQVLHYYLVALQALYPTCLCVCVWPPLGGRTGYCIGQLGPPPGGGTVTGLWTMGRSPYPWPLWAGPRPLINFVGGLWAMGRSPYPWPLWLINFVGGLWAMGRSPYPWPLWAGPWPLINFVGQASVVLEMGNSAPI